MTLSSEQLFRILSKINHMKALASANPSSFGLPSQNFLQNYKGQQIAIDQTLLSNARAVWQNPSEATLQSFFRYTIDPSSYAQKPNIAAAWGVQHENRVTGSALFTGTNDPQQNYRLFLQRLAGEYQLPPQDVEKILGPVFPLLSNSYFQPVFRRSHERNGVSYDVLAKLDSFNLSTQTIGDFKYTGQLSNGTNYIDSPQTSAYMFAVGGAKGIDPNLLNMAYGVTYRSGNNDVYGSSLIRVPHMSQDTATQLLDNDIGILHSVLQATGMEREFILHSDAVMDRRGEPSQLAKMRRSPILVPPTIVLPNSSFITRGVDPSTLSAQQQADMASSATKPTQFQLDAQYKNDSVQEAMLRQSEITGNYFARATTMMGQLLNISGRNISMRAARYALKGGGYDAYRKYIAYQLGETNLDSPRVHEAIDRIDDQIVGFEELQGEREHEKQHDLRDRRRATLVKAADAFWGKVDQQTFENQIEPLFEGIDVYSSAESFAQQLVSARRSAKRIIQSMGGASGSGVRTANSILRNAQRVVIRRNLSPEMEQRVQNELAAVPFEGDVENYKDELARILRVKEKLPLLRPFETMDPMFYRRLQDLPLGADRERVSELARRVSATRNDPIQNKRALYEFNKAIEQATATTHSLQRAFLAFGHTLGSIPFYNGETIANVVSGNLGSWQSSSSGFVPRELQPIQGHFTRILQDQAKNWWYRNYELKYRTVEGLRGPINTFASSIGGVISTMAGAGPLPGMAIGSAIGGLATGIPALSSQIAGNITENRLKQWGMQVGTALNMFSIFDEGLKLVGNVLKPVEALIKNTIHGVFNTFHTALKGFGTALGISTALMIKTVKDLDRFMNDGLSRAAQLGNPITGLSGVRYPIYQRLGLSDTFLGLSTGTLSGSMEDFGRAQANLYSRGQIDDNRLIASSLLGIFNDVYSNSGDPSASYATALNKLVRQYNRAQNNPQEQKRILTLAEDISPGWGQTIQVMSDMGITDFNKMQSPGYFAYYRELGSNKHWRFKGNAIDERGYLRAVSSEYNANIASMDLSKQRVAASIWSHVGRNLYSGFNRAWDLVSRGHWANWRDTEGNVHQGAVTTFVSSLSNAFQDVKSWLSSSDIAKGLREGWNEAVSLFTSFIESTDWSGMLNAIGKGLSSVFSGIGKFIDDNNLIGKALGGLKNLGAKIGQWWDESDLKEKAIGMWNQYGTPLLEFIKNFGSLAFNTFANLFQMFETIRFDWKKALAGEQFLFMGPQNLNKQAFGLIPTDLEWAPYEARTGARLRIASNVASAHPELAGLFDTSWSNKYGLPLKVGITKERLYQEIANSGLSLDDVIFKTILPDNTEGTIGYTLRDLLELNPSQFQGITGADDYRTWALLKGKMHLWDSSDKAEFMKEQVKQTISNIADTTETVWSANVPDILAKLEKALDTLVTKGSNLRITLIDDKGHEIDVPIDKSVGSSGDTSMAVKVSLQQITGGHPIY